MRLIFSTCSSWPGLARPVTNGTNGAVLGDRSIGHDEGPLLAGYDVQTAAVVKLVRGLTVQRAE
ncbi:MAG: hypothetical protein OTI34_12295 [Lewinella sp.]|nr:hypothetical protein [Lewinella sp.]